MRRLVRGCLSTAELRTIATRCPVSGVVDLADYSLPMKYYAEGDDVLADILYYLPDRYAPTIALMAELAGRSRVVLDIGANTGMYAVVTGKANPEAEVYAFEPHPGNFKRLQRNLEVNGLSNVRAVPEAAGETTGEIPLVIQADGAITMVASAVGEFARGFYGGNHREITCPCTTIDAFVASHALSAVDLLKIDVEYYEVEVLKGARETIDAHSPIVWCEVFVYEFAVHTQPNFNTNLDPDHSRKIEEFMRGLGYYFYSIQEQGLVRVDTLDYCPGQWEFLFSRRRSEARFLPYTDLPALSRELTG